MDAQGALPYRDGAAADSGDAARCYRPTSRSGLSRFRLYVVHGFAGRPRGRTGPGFASFAPEPELGDKRRRLKFWSTPESVAIAQRFDRGANRRFVDAAGRRGLAGAQSTKAANDRDRHGGKESLFRSEERRVGKDGSYVWWKGD